LPFDIIRYSDIR